MMLPPRTLQEENGTTAISETGGDGKRKRPRPAFSCLQCRLKKLKCNRGHPCDRCIKRFKSDPSVAQECTYRQDASLGEVDATGEGNVTVVDVNIEEQEVERGQMFGLIRPERERPAKMARLESRNFGDRPAPEEEQPRLGVIEDLQARLEKVEKMLSAHKEAGHVLPARPASNREGMLRAKGDSSCYHPVGNRMSFIKHFRDSNAFCKPLDKNDLPESMKEIRAIEKRFSRKYKYREHPGRNMDNHDIVLKFLEGLPSRETCDKLMQKYFASFENVYRILHEPSFLEQCAEFWMYPEEARADMFEWFIPQYVLVLAMGAKLDNTVIHPDEYRDGRLPLWGVFDLVETWADQLNGKRRNNFAALQVKCLLLVAQKASGVPAERSWSFTGTLVRSAIKMGLHLDPANFSQLSIFQGEMRRRLWATIVELDFQASLLCGSPTAVRVDDFSCLPPRNLNDIYLSADMQELPDDISNLAWTDSLCQSILAKSLPERLKAMAMIWNLNVEPDYNAILAQVAKMEKILRSLPVDLRIDENPQTFIDQPGRILGQVMLDTFVQRVTISLCRPFALHLQGAEFFPEARRVCVKASLAILAHQERLLEAHNGVYEEIYFKMCRPDIVQSALTVCLEAKDIGKYAAAQLLSKEPSSSHSACLQSPSPTLAVSQATYTSPYSRDHLLAIVETAIEGQLQRIGEYNWDLKDSVILTVALQSIILGPAAQHKRILGLSAEMVLEVCRKRFPPQDQSPTDAASDSAGTGLLAQGTPVDVEDYAKGGLPEGFNPNVIVPLESFDYTNFDITSAEMDFLFPMEWDWNHAWS